MKKNLNIIVIILYAILAILCILWAITIQENEYINKIKIAAQVFTASLAPLAFYIAVCNYWRKSGINLSIKVEIEKPHDFLPYYQYVKSILIQNNKDKTIAITEIFLIFEENYAVKLDSNLHNIKAYETVQVEYDPVSYYYQENLTLRCLYNFEDIFHTDEKKVRALNNSVGDHAITPELQKKLDFPKPQKILIKTFDNQCLITPNIRDKSILPVKPYHKFNDLNIIEISRRYYITDQKYRFVWPYKIDYALVFAKKRNIDERYIIGLELDDNNQISNLQLFSQDFNSQKGFPNHQKYLALRKLSIKTNEDFLALTKEFYEFFPEECWYCNHFEKFNTNYLVNVIK